MFIAAVAMSVGAVVEGSVVRNIKLSQADPTLVPFTGSDGDPPLELMQFCRMSPSA